jgi:hypothetical protein
VAEQALELDHVGDLAAAAMSEERIDITPVGMFYADAIAGLLAWRRMQTFRHQDRRTPDRDRLRDRNLVNEAAFSWMG